MNELTIVYAPIPRWCLISGMGRTRVFEEITRGNLRAIKLGSRTLIDVQAGLAWLGSLPNVTANRKQAA